MDRRRFLELSLLAGAGAMFVPSLLAGENKAFSSKKCWVRYLGHST